MQEEFGSCNALTDCMDFVGMPEDDPTPFECRPPIRVLEGFLSNTQAQTAEMAGAISYGGSAYHFFNRNSPHWHADFTGMFGGRSPPPDNERRAAHRHSRLPGHRDADDCRVGPEICRTRRDRPGIGRAITSGEP